MDQNIEIKSWRLICCPQKVHGNDDERPVARLVAFPGVLLQNNLISIFGLEPGSIFPLSPTHPNSPHTKRNVRNIHIPPAPAAALRHVPMVGRCPADRTSEMNSAEAKCLIGASFLTRFQIIIFASKLTSLSLPLSLPLSTLVGTAQLHHPPSS